MQDFVAEIQCGRRSHKDPFFIEGNVSCLIGRIEPVFDIDDEELCHKTVPTFPCDVAGCSQTFTLVYEYEQHYNSAHRYVCKECRKTMPSPHLLDLHIMETHDTYFSVLSERKPMFQCFVEECTIKFSAPEERRSHCIEEHKFPSGFRFDCTRKTRGGKGKPASCGKKGIPHVKSTSSADGKMEDENAGSESILPPPKPKLSSIPKAFTFGHYQERTFLGNKTRGGKSKHWYQKDKSVDSVERAEASEEIPGMEELMESLPADSTW